MAVSSTDNPWRPPDWLIKLLRLPWKSRKSIVGNTVSNAIASVLVFLLFVHEKDLKGTNIEWAFQNRWLFLSLVLAWAFITFIISPLFHLVPLSGSDTKLSNKEIQRRYLNQIRQDTELLTLKGIPAGLISESVRLDEVFIPLEFRANRPRTDYPLTEKELERFRELRHVGKLSVEQERVLIGAEHDWEHILKQSDRISIADLWQRLTRDQPAAVIQGAPGIGKSTLMERLTLHMARRCLGEADLKCQGMNISQPHLFLSCFVWGNMLPLVAMSQSFLSTSILKMSWISSISPALTHIWSRNALRLAVVLSYLMDWTR